MKTIFSKLAPRIAGASASAAVAARLLNKSSDGSTSPVKQPSQRSFYRQYSHVPSTSVPTNSSLSYAGAKKGGTDVGHIVQDQNGQETLIKTGITLSLLGQALRHAADGDHKKMEKKISFITGNYHRLTSEKDKSRKKNDKSTLLASFNNFLNSEQGTQMLSRTELGAKDVQEIFDFLCQDNPKNKDIVGLPAMFDIFNGAATQKIVNDFFKLSKSHNPSASIIQETEGKKALYFGSDMVQNAQPMEAYLLDVLDEAGAGYEGIRHVADSVEKCQKKWSMACETSTPIAEEILSQVSSPKNLSQAQKALLDKINNEEGFTKKLLQSIMIRFMVGESADLGPDNMLVKDGTPIDIDLTGYRYDRAKDFTDPRSKQTRKGWQTVLADSDGESLTRNLLSKDVFNTRYASGLPKAIPKMVSDAIAQSISPEEALKARDEVLEYFANLDIDVVKKEDLFTRTHMLYNMPSEKRPDMKQVDSVLSRNHNTFLEKIVEFSKNNSSN